MNMFSIGTHPVPGGHIAWIRKVHRAENEIIRGKGGHPIVYPTKAEAKAAAGDAMCAYLNGSLVRDGAIIEARSKAEELFNLPKVRARA